MNDVFEVNEDLWFGDTDDAQAEQNAAESMAAMVGRILGAKPFPVAARRLEELTRNPSTRIDQIVRVLEGDPALSARLLRLVNSAGYALRLRCTSVRHAAALVGMRRLHQVATTAAVLDMFDANSDAAVDILEHAAIVGSFCRYLGVHLGLPRDELFTCGFLHDIGKLMMLDTEGQGYAALLAEHSGRPATIHLYEREKYGFDHAVLAAHVLSAWNIPDPVPKVVAWHHQVARAYQAGTTIAAMVQALRLADALSYVVGKVSNYEAIVQIANSEAALYLEISEPQLAAMWSDLVALRQQSRVGARGSEVSELVVMPPRREAQLPAAGPKRAVEAPKHFPCVACKKPSFGNTCPCCRGHVCPEHQTRAGEWCVLCVREYDRTRAAEELTLSDSFQLVLGAALIAAIAGWGAASVPGAEWHNIVLGPVLALGMSVVLFAVGRRWRLRTRFLRGRQRRPRMAEGAAAAASGKTNEPEPDSEPEILVIDNSIPPNGLSQRPYSMPVSGSPSFPASMPVSESPSYPASPSLVQVSYAPPNISVRSGMTMPSNMPPAPRTGFEGMARCSLRPLPEVMQSMRPENFRTQILQAVQLPIAEPAPETTASPGTDPEPHSSDSAPASSSSVRIPASAAVPVILINDIDTYQIPEARFDAPAIAVRFSSMPAMSDSAFPRDSETPPYSTSGRVTTWENTTHRP